METGAGFIAGWFAQPAAGVVNLSVVKGLAGAGEPRAGEPRAGEPAPHRDWGFSGSGTFLDAACIVPVAWKLHGMSNTDAGFRESVYAKTLRRNGYDLVGGARRGDGDLHTDPRHRCGCSSGR